MARPTLMVYTYFFIFLPSISAESGSGSEASVGYGTCADAEQDNGFKCFIQMPVFQSNFLICDATGTEMNLNEANASFSVVGICKQRTTNHFSFKYRYIARLPLWNTLQYCNVEIKPEAPFDLNITYQETANEYLVQFSTPHIANSFLENKLIHQLAYRQENADWTTIESYFLILKLLGKKFQPEVTYEMKVRSKPNGDYFKGHWSEWSSSQYFKTSARISNGMNKLVLLTVSVTTFFLLLIVIFLVPVFWKNRIKEMLWPSIPNHQKTLDKFCNKLRKNSDASFFNPESLGYTHIHKVDSIQAKSEIAHLQPPSHNLDADVENLVKRKDSIHHGWLKLPLAYEGMLPTETKNQLSSGSEDTSADDSFPSINLCDEGRLADQHGWNNDLGKNSNSLMGHIILPELKTGSCCQVYPNGEKRLLNNEETYVTMASFFENKGKLRN